MTEAGHPTGGAAVKRIALGVATAVLSINIWTGCPLLALWVGSQTVGSTRPSMGAVALVVLILAALVFSSTLALTWLSAKYDKATGRPTAARRTSPWLRSMRGEREEVARHTRGISGVERTVVVSVVACIITFEIWFFFFAGSSLPNP